MSEELLSTSAEVSNNSPIKRASSFPFPLSSILTDELEQAIINDDKIKKLPIFSDEWDKRMEEIRIENNLEYYADKSPKWVKDSKGSKPYLVTYEEFQNRYP
jgi:hypothetical protein